LVWKGQHYSTIVQLDGFDPGHCDWSFRSVVVSGVDDRGQVLEMAEWSSPPRDEKKAYSAPEVWGDLVMLTTEPLPKEDQSGVRNLICTPGYENPYRPHVLRCGIKHANGQAFGSTLWITPSTRQAEVYFRY
jgi:hypothetical protein